MENTDLERMVEFVDICKATLQEKGQVFITESRNSDATYRAFSDCPCEVEPPRGYSNIWRIKKNSGGIEGYHCDCYYNRDILVRTTGKLATHQLGSIARLVRGDIRGMIPDDRDGSLRVAAIYKK